MFLLQMKQNGFLQPKTAPQKLIPQSITFSTEAVWCGVRALFQRFVNPNTQNSYTKGLLIRKS